MHLCLDIICPTHIDYHTQSPTERNIGKKKQPLQKNGKKHHLKHLSHKPLSFRWIPSALFVCKTSQKSPRCGPGRTTSRHVFIKAKFITQIDHCHDLRMTVIRMMTMMAMDGHKSWVDGTFPREKNMALCVFVTVNKQTSWGQQSCGFCFFVCEYIKSYPFLSWLCQVSVVPLRCPANCCSSCASSDTELGRLAKVSWSMLFLRMSHSK